MEQTFALEYLVKACPPVVEMSRAERIWRVKRLNRQKQDEKRAIDERTKGWYSGAKVKMRPPS